MRQLVLCSPDHVHYGGCLPVLELRLEETWCVELRSYLLRYLSVVASEKVDGVLEQVPGGVM